MMILIFTTLWLIINDFTWSNNFYITFQMLTYLLKNYFFNVRVFQKLIISYHLAKMMENSKLYNLLSIGSIIYLPQSPIMLWLLFGRYVLIIMFNIFRNPCIYYIYIGYLAFLAFAYLDMTMVILQAMLQYNFSFGDIWISYGFNMGLIIHELVSA